MFFELRQYTVKPGQFDAWLKLFEEEIMPFQITKGMTILGSWRGETDDTVWAWLRRFDSESERERLYKEVYESEYWVKEIAPRTREMLVREEIKVTRLTATGRSFIQ